MRHLVASLLASPVAALACSPCRAQVQAGIFDGSFLTRLLVLSAPVLVVVAVAAVVLWSDRSSRNRS